MSDKSWLPPSPGKLYQQYQQLRTSGGTGGKGSSTGTGHSPPRISEEDAPAERDNLPTFTNNVGTTYAANALSSYLQQTLGLSAGDANAYLNYWAESFQMDNRRWPGVEDFDDPALIGALGMVAQLPPAFKYQGVLYTNQGGLPGVANYGVGNTPIAELTPEYIMGILSQAGGGGGGGGSRDPVFDRDALKEKIEGDWRFYLIDVPDNTPGLVDRFVAEAQAFARQGGSLNLDTWILNRVRESPEYRRLYRFKQPEESEADYINRFRGTVNQFGLATSQASELIRQGAQGGAGAQGFAEQVAMSRPVMAANPGGFGRKVANAVAQLGVLNR